MNLGAEPEGAPAPLLQNTKPRACTHVLAPTPLAHFHHQPKKHPKLLCPCSDSSPIRKQACFSVLFPVQPALGPERASSSHLRTVAIPLSRAHSGPLPSPRSPHQTSPPLSSPVLLAPPPPPRATHCRCSCLFGSASARGVFAVLRSKRRRRPSRAWETGQAQTLKPAGWPPSRPPFLGQEVPRESGLEGCVPSSLGQPTDSSLYRRAALNLGYRLQHQIPPPSP